MIVGNGNVALDVARILVTDPDQLAKTDLAEHALEALRNSKIREVVILGRRGPAQAAYTNPELLALGQMANVDVVVDPIEAELDEASQAFVDSDAAEPSVLLKVKQAQEFASRTADPSRKRIVLRFLTSPVEVLGDGAVSQVRIVKKTNWWQRRPVSSPPGLPRPRRRSTLHWCFGRSDTAAHRWPTCPSTTLAA